MTANKHSPKYFKICAEKRLNEFLHQQDVKLEAQIDQESDDYINNVDEASYIKYLSDRYSLDTPYLDFDKREVSSGRKNVPAEDFPYGQFNVRSGRSYLMGVVTFHIPCSGDVNLLPYYSDNFLVHNGPIGYTEDNHLCFEITDFYDDLERVKLSSHSVINNIGTLSSGLIREIEEYNYGLERKIKRFIEERKKKISSIVQVLGVPIKKRENLSSSYAVPTPESRKFVSLKPQVVDHGNKIEYSLGDTIYFDILQVINDYGKVFEQYPSTYSGKQEEELRNHFLLILQPKYKGAATGETFNKSGKTDILIKHENTTVFIAECKFWRGQKSYIDTVNQLLGYLIWRNSKAAIVLFVKNKDFSSVLYAVKEATPTHPNFIRFVNEQDESWLNYVFHINDNPDREVRLAVLLFHIPPVGESISEVDEK
ncbi:MAG: hypothetical protein WKF74_15095 [Pyrinomonadaceae bacterium]